MSDFTTPSGSTDSRLIAGLVIQHIEQILPEIIEDLDIPDPMSRAERWRLEAGISCKPGFRHFGGAKKKTAIAILKTDNIRRQLLSFVKASAHASFGGGSSYTAPKTLFLGGSTWIERTTSRQYSDTKATAEDLPLTSYSRSYAEGSESSDVLATLPLMTIQAAKDFGFEGGIDTETHEAAIPDTLLKQDVSGRRAPVKGGRLPVWSIDDLSSQISNADMPGTIITALWRCGLGAVADRLSYLHRTVEDDQDEPSINLDSLRKLALFLLSERRLGNPQLGVNPNGLILAEWPVGEKGVLAMEFLASGAIRFAAISGPAQRGVEIKRISGTLSKSETLNAVRPFADFIASP